jgi:hypothetical protein
MAFTSFNILGHQFDIKFEWDQSLTSYPVQFIFFQGRRVGLFDENDNTDTLYFDAVTMTELFGSEFTPEYFSIGINFGLFDQTNLTLDEINDKKQAINIMIKSADDVLQLYFSKDRRTL